jgi:sec-independent protein translocase protein TatA
MDGISLTQMLVIGVIVLILFGSKKLPEFGKSIGKSIRSFKDGLSEIDADAKDITNTQLSQQNQTTEKKEETKTKTEV